MEGILMKYFCVRHIDMLSLVLESKEAAVDSFDGAEGWASRLA
jgi:hypothetical protein